MENKVMLAETDFVGETELDESITICRCVRCGQEKESDVTNKWLCISCVKLENGMITHRRSHNEGWMTVAKEAEIELWERQPRETDREWGIWLCYRDQYPSKKPTFVDVAASLGTTVSNVRSVGSRWDFSVRMQAWAKRLDLITVEQRTREVLDMNAKHISMAKRLNKKLSDAIDILDVDLLTPTQLGALMKTATELEKKANIGLVDTHEKLNEVRDEQMGVHVGHTDALKKNNKEDLQEIIDILSKAGALSMVAGGSMKITKTEFEVGAPSPSGCGQEKDSYNYDDDDDVIDITE